MGGAPHKFKKTLKSMRNKIKIFFHMGNHTYNIKSAIFIACQVSILILILT